MFKQIFLSTLLICFCDSILANNTNAQEKELMESKQQQSYIIDNLYVFMHSGPGKDYRIVGSIEAGSEISKINQDENGFSQITDIKNRTAWVESKFITVQPSMTVKISELDDALSQSRTALSDLEGKLPSLQSKNNKLVAENEQLQMSIADLQKQLSEGQNEKHIKNQKEEHVLLTYGGGIALVGLLIGVFLTLFISRNRRHDGWA